MVTHPAHGATSGTLVNAILGHVGSLPGDTLRPGLVHRLDRDTSGLLLVAKNSEALSFLSKGMKARHISREYLGLAVGIPAQSKGTINGAIGRDDGDITGAAAPRARSAELVRRDESRPLSSCAATGSARAALADATRGGRAGAPTSAWPRRARTPGAPRLRAAPGRGRPMRRDLGHERERATSAEAAVRHGRVTGLDGDSRHPAERPATPITPTTTPSARRRDRRRRRRDPKRPTAVVPALPATRPTSARRRRPPRRRRGRSPPRARRADEARGTGSAPRARHHGPTAERAPPRGRPGRDGPRHGCPPPAAPERPARPPGSPAQPPSGRATSGSHPGQTLNIAPSRRG